jgi:hypothetical protein
LLDPGYSEHPDASEDKGKVCHLLN